MPIVSRVNSKTQAVIERLRNGTGNRKVILSAPLEALDRRSRHWGAPRSNTVIVPTLVYRVLGEYNGRFDLEGFDSVILLHVPKDAVEDVISFIPEAAE